MSDARRIARARERLVPPGGPARVSSRIATLDRVLLGLALGATGAAALHRLVAYDVWWQIAAGRWIAAHGWPVTDPFSYAAAGRRWVEMRWLYCLAVARMYDLAGPNALIVTSVVAALLAGVALARLDPEAPSWIPALGLAVAVALALYRLDVRPEMLTFLFLEIVLLWLARVAAGRTAPPWWSLGILQLVWVNSHTLSILGPATLGLFGVAEELAPRFLPRRLRPFALPISARRRVLAAAMLSAAVCLLNPWGWRGVAMYFTLLGQLSSERSAGRWITELQSPLAHLGWSFVGLRLPFAVALSAMALWRNRRSARFGWVAVWLAFLVIGLSAERNLALFGWVAGSTIVIQLGAQQRARRRSDVATRRSLFARRGAIAIGLAAIGLLVSDTYYRRVDPDRRFGLGVAPGRFPDRPLAFLATTGFGDRRLLANLSDSDYVLFARGERSVFADGRLEVYDGETLQRAFDLYQTGRDLPAVARRFDIRTVIVESDRDGGMLRALLRDRAWAAIYFDADRVVFALAGSADDSVARRRIDWQAVGDATQTDLPGESPAVVGGPRLAPERLRGLGRLGTLVGNLEMARRFDRRALVAGARGRDLIFELAAVERLLGDGPAADELLAGVAGGEHLRLARNAVLAFAAADGLEAALAGLEAMAARGELDDPRLFQQLVPWSLRSGRLDRGVLIARSWTARRPESVTAWMSRAVIERLRGDSGEAAAALGRARELAPADPTLLRLESGWGLRSRP